MENVGFAILSAGIAFLFTNIDDFCLLILYFARCQSDKNWKAQNVWIGQILGFSILCALSLIGIVVGLFLPTKYIRLLGFLPILMGLKSGYEYYKENHQTDVETNHQIHDVETILIEDQQQPPISSPSENLTSEDEESTCLSRTVNQLFRNCLNVQALEVATITIANGGDNIAIYLPIFASASPQTIVITLAVFYFLLFLFLLSTSTCVKGQTISAFLEKWGPRFVPFFLVGLGVYVLYGSVVWPES